VQFFEKAAEFVTGGGVFFGMLCGVHRIVRAVILLPLFCLIVRNEAVLCVIF